MCTKKKNSQKIRSEVRPFRKMIGKSIRKQRIRHELTIGQLAFLAGISFRKLDLYEIGKHRIDIEAAAKISKALKISLHELFQ